MDLQPLQNLVAQHQLHLAIVGSGAGFFSIATTLVRRAIDLYQSRLIQRILAATAEDSPGGSSITRDELLAIITDPRIRASFVALFTEKA